MYVLCYINVDRKIFRVCERSQLFRLKVEGEYLANVQLRNDDGAHCGVYVFLRAVPAKY